MKRSLEGDSDESPSKLLYKIHKMYNNGIIN